MEEQEHKQKNASSQLFPDVDLISGETRLLLNATFASARFSQLNAFVSALKKNPQNFKENFFFLSFGLRRFQNLVSFLYSCHHLDFNSVDTRQKICDEQGSAPSNLNYFQCLIDWFQESAQLFFDCWCPAGVCVSNETEMELVNAQECSKQNGVPVWSLLTWSILKLNRIPRLHCVVVVKKSQIVCRWIGCQAAVAALSSCSECTKTFARFCASAQRPKVTLNEQFDKHFLHFMFFISAGQLLLGLTEARKNLLGESSNPLQNQALKTRLLHWLWSNSWSTSFHTGDMWSTFEWLTGWDVTLIVEWLIAGAELTAMINLSISRAGNFTLLYGFVLIAL